MTDIISFEIEASASSIALASYLNCNPELVEHYVDLAGCWIEATAENIKEDKRVAVIYADALKLVERAKKKLATLPNDELRILELAGSNMLKVTDALELELSSISKHRNEITKRENIVGNRNPLAYKLADAVSAIFKYLERPITFGVSPSNNDEPSTEFGRAVQKAFEFFYVYKPTRPLTDDQKSERKNDGKWTPVIASWRDPAKAAWKKYK